MTSENMDVRAEGTLVKEKDKMYWFTTGKLVGKEVVINSVVTIFRDLAGRDLTGFEKGLAIAVPRSGTSSVTVLTALAIDSSERDYLKSIKRETCAYVLRTRGSSPYQNVDPIGTHAVYTPEGELLGQVTKSYKPEPALEKSFLDPIDIMGGVLAPFVKKALFKLAARVASRVTARSGAASLAEKLVREVRKANQRVVVNIGGTGEVKGAINLNPNIVAARKDIPNHIARGGEEIGEVFGANTIDEIVSNRLPPNTIDWVRTLAGSHKVLKKGGMVSIRFQGVGGDSKVILEQLNKLGFRNIKDHFHAAFEAVK